MSIISRGTFFTTLILLLLPFNNIRINAECAPGCYDGWQGDNVCDNACYNAACNWDDGDCDDDSPSCSWLCDSSVLGDGTCNYFCSGADCNYDNGDCNESCDYSNECGLDSIGDGSCGLFSQTTDKWCEFDGALVCCSDEPDFSDCCEANTTAISITVVGIFLFVAITSIWAWRRKRRDNTKDDPPKLCYKLWCPVCSVVTHQGCESKLDICMSYLCCCWFSVCCWSPKAVVVVDNDENYSVDCELPYVTATVISTESIECVRKV
jgi:hypothetical protein